MGTTFTDPNGAHGEIVASRDKARIQSFLAATYARVFGYGLAC